MYVFYSSMTFDSTFSVEVWPN